MSKAAPPVHRSGRTPALRTSPCADALPGERCCDESILDQAVADLNRMYRVKGLETARMVGEYILATFFNGDPVAFRDRSSRHLTFRGLASREDLEMSHSFIWYSVSVLDQLRELPTDIAEALPLSHHRLLLPVRDTQAKLNLARDAVRLGLSKRELEARIRALRENRPPQRNRGGRPRLPAFVKGIGQLEKAVELATEQTLCPALFSHYSVDEAKDQLGRLYQQLARMDELAEDLRRLLDTMEQSSRQPDAGPAPLRAAAK